MTTDEQQYKDQITPEMALENLHNAARMIKADANTHTALQFSYLLLKGVIEKPDERVARRYQDGGETQPPAEPPVPPEDEAAERDPKPPEHEYPVPEVVEPEPVEPEPGPAKKVSTTHRTCKVVSPKPKKAAKKTAKKAGGGK